MARLGRHPLPTFDPAGALTVYKRRALRTVAFWTVAALALGIPLLAASALVHAFDLTEAAVALTVVGALLGQLVVALVVGVAISELRAGRRPPPRDLAHK